MQPHLQAQLKEKKIDDSASATATDTTGGEDDAVDKFMEEMHALGALTT